MNRTRPEFALMNGEVVPYAEARISIMAPGLTFAVTVFEGFRGYWSEQHQELNVFRVGAHLDRMRFGMSLLEIDGAPSNEAFAEQITRVVQANEMREDCYIRMQAYIDDWGDMTATGPLGTSVICRSRPRTEAFTHGKRFGVASWRRNTDDASPPRVKATANYLNSRLAGLEAKRNGFDGAVILNHDGTVAEGPGGCLFMQRDGVLVTPTVNDGILESITRDTVLHLAQTHGLAAQQRRIGRTELYLADELFYCGTGQEIAPIVSVDGKAIGDGAPGPTTRKLQNAYDQLVRGQAAAPEGWLSPVWEHSSESLK
jgi:branched-chain amino acid aminotransferase